MKKSTPFIIDALTALTDIVFLILADLTSFALRFNGEFPVVNFEAYLQLAFFILTIRIICFYIFSLYDLPRYASPFFIFINIAKAITASSVVITFVIYFMDISSYPRVVAFLSWLLSIVFIFGWRLVARKIGRRVFGAGRYRARLVVIGTDKLAKEAALFALRDASADYDFLGYLSARKDAPVEVDESAVICTVADFIGMAKSFAVDKAIIADPTIDKATLTRLLTYFSRHHIVVTSMPHTYDKIISEMVLTEWPTMFTGYTLRARQLTWYAGLKRFLDVILALGLLIATLPLTALTAIAVKLSSKGPIFYMQKRSGLHGIRFTMIKFRTMYFGAEKAGHPAWAKTEDARITPLGKILRRFRIDELPQLINVLRNEMSMIGPRPERPYFASKLLRKIPFYAERLKVKPGITGWAQVNYSYAATLAASEEKLLYDIFYVQNISLTLDLLIALKTVNVVLTGRGAQ